MANENEGLRVKRLIPKNIGKYTMIIALVAIWVFFEIITKGIFLTPRNMNNLFLQMTFIGIASSAMVLIMVAGHIDLSAGSVVGFIGAVIAVLLRSHNTNVFLALLICVAIGAAIGIWQGYWVAYLGIPAFIVTLSSQLVFRGGVLGVTQGSTVQPDNAIFKAIGQGYLPNIGGPDASLNVTAILAGALFIIFYIAFSIKKRRDRIKFNFIVDKRSKFILKLIAMSIVIALVFQVWAKDRGIPIAIIILGVVVLIMHIVSTRTAFGRHVYAIGGNRDAAELSGINVKKTTMFIFIIMGIAASISGIVYTSRLNAAAIAGGTGSELDIIASAIIGGTSPSGGSGTVLGCIIGALVMASLDNGMSLLSLGSFEKYVVKGLVLLFAVVVDTINKRKL